MTEFSNERYDVSIGVDENAVWVKLIFRNDDVAREYGDILRQHMADGDPFAIAIGGFLTEVREETMHLPRTAN
jgi:hypothetical protein